MVHIQNGIILSPKKWNDAICSNMDGFRDYHTKWNKPDREGQIPNVITYMWNLSMTQMSISMKEKQTHGNREQTCGFQERGDWGGRNRRFGLTDVNYYIWNV